MFRLSFEKNLLFQAGQSVINTAIQHGRRNYGAIPFVCPENKMLDIAFFIRYGGRTRDNGAFLIMLCCLGGFFIIRRLNIFLIIMNLIFVVAFSRFVCLAVWHLAVNYHDTQMLLSM